MTVRYTYKAYIYHKQHLFNVGTFNSFDEAVVDARKEANSKYREYGMCVTEMVDKNSVLDEHCIWVEDIPHQEAPMFVEDMIKEAEKYKKLQRFNRFEIMDIE